MPSCEKCWSDAHLGPQHSVADEYRRLVAERDAAGRTCSPEQQAGPEATECSACGRVARHQHVGVCMACGHDPQVVRVAHCIQPDEPDDLADRAPELQAEVEWLRGALARAARLVDAHEEADAARSEALGAFDAHRKDASHD